MADNPLTEQQRKWMASVRASMEVTTGRNLDQWVEIARSCPETKPKARQKWFKDTHGLGQNYCMLVLSELARRSGESPRDPDVLRKALWSDPGCAAIATALQAGIDTLPGAITGQRKTYTTWSRSFAFASARPMRDGQLRLGLAVPPEADPRLQPATNEGWSERLKSTLVLSTPGDLNEDLMKLLRTAWAVS